MRLNRTPTTSEHTAVFDPIWLVLLFAVLAELCQIMAVVTAFQRLNVVGVVYMSLVGCVLLASLTMSHHKWHLLRSMDPMQRPNAAFIGSWSAVRTQIAQNVYSRPFWAPQATDFVDFRTIVTIDSLLGYTLECFPFARAPLVGTTEPIDYSAANVIFLCRGNRQNLRLAEPNTTMVSAHGMLHDIRKVLCHTRGRIA